MRTSAAVLMAAGFMLSGCATQTPQLTPVAQEYTQTARKLWATTDVGPATAYETKWTPAGKDASYFLNADEITRANADVDLCIADLSKSAEFSPPEVTRAVQLMDCMAAKGWHVSVRELLVLE